MEELFRRLERRQRRHRVACYVFIAAVGILYATNIIMRAAVHHDSVWVYKELKHTYFQLTFKSPPENND